ncbi:hypothetical protein [Streptomyces ipomoeae]|uniref:hypothetical protein n=1 Tax=Streptomyces ipomoeae TaxID=103232 RepID=UPI00114719B7|nr:hypothetical protein [Streptomyces ipomoeae]TQE33101.1 hypothetical protein Sipo7851_21625 [Streptomyces ipomoeae]
MVSNHARKNAARGARGAGQTHRQAVDAVRRDAPAKGRIIVAPGDRVPRDTIGHPACPIKPGDVLRVSCPAGQAKVDDVWDASTVVIEWPWTEPDAKRRPTFALRLPETDHPVQFAVPFRNTPDRLRDVRKGDTITVDMPPAVVHVSYSDATWYADDRDAGRPPADSHVLVAVLPYGVNETPETTRDGADQRLLLRPWAAAPMTVELLCRPYEMLKSHDKVRDAAGTEWTYTGPLDFHTPGRRTPRTEGPVWPLTLIERYMSEPGPEAIEAVAVATATGSHQEELDRWREASGADLVEFPTHEVPDVLSAAQKLALATQARRSVVGKTLEEVEEAREAARRVYRLVSKVVLDEEDQRRLEEAVVKLDTLDEVLAEMRLAGAERYEGPSVDSVLNTRPRQGGADARPAP